MIEILQLQVFDDFVELKDYVNKKPFFNEFIYMDLSINDSYEKDDVIYEFELNVCDLDGLKNGILDHEKSFINKGIMELKTYNLVIMRVYKYETFMAYINSIFSEVIKRAKLQGYSNNSDIIAMELNNYFYWRDSDYYCKRLLEDENSKLVKKEAIIKKMINHIRHKNK